MTLLHYFQDIGTIPGTKILGYPDSDFPSADRNCICGRRMVHLFTVESREVDEAYGEWYWRYDPTLKGREVHPTIELVGLDILDGEAVVFYCDQCPGRPIAAHFVNG